MPQHVDVSDRTAATSVDTWLRLCPGTKTTSSAPRTVPSSAVSIRLGAESLLATFGHTGPVPIHGQPHRSTVLFTWQVSSRWMI